MSMNRLMGSEHDGSDHEYRMTIQQRYKEMSTLRPRVKLGARVQLISVMLRSLWKYMPCLLLGWTYSMTDLGILIAGVALFLLYGYAMGDGRRQQEKVWAVMLYNMGSMFLAAEVG